MRRFSSRIRSSSSCRLRAWAVQVGSSHDTTHHVMSFQRQMAASASPRHGVTARDAHATSKPRPCLAARLPAAMAMPTCPGTLPGLPTSLAPFNHFAPLLLSSRGPASMPACHTLPHTLAPPPRLIPARPRAACAPAGSGAPPPAAPSPAPPAAPAPLAAGPGYAPASVQQDTQISQGGGCACQWA